MLHHPSTLTRRATLAALVAAAPAIARPQEASPWAAVEAAAAEVIAAKAAPGFQACVRRRGEVLFSRGFGQANLEHGAAMTTQTPCRVASITKEFTAALVQLLAQDGALSLDDRLSRHLRDFPASPALTLRHMLNHTGGLWNHTATEDTRRLLRLARSDYTDAEMLAFLKATDKIHLFEPGTSWAYSNGGYILLAMVLEKVSGRSYAELLEQRITRPLGLTRTAVDDRDQMVPGRAQGYTNDRAAPGGYRNGSFVSTSWSKGAGNMRSTAEDLCAWHEALLGGRVLPPAMLEAMMTPATLANGATPQQRYGLGLMIGESQGRRFYYHDGSTVGFIADVRTFPTGGVTMAYIFNADGGDPRPDPETLRLINRCRSALLAAAVAQGRPA